MKAPARNRVFWGRWALACVLMGLCSCRTTIPAAPPESPGPSVRFLISFDDGPSARTGYNPTADILDQLAHNDLQPGVRAIFFIQTHHPRGGGTPVGRRLIRRMHEEGHVIGLHSISPQGHMSHISMADDELAARLIAARRMIRDLTGQSARFVRPPYGAASDRTRALYESLGFSLLMCNLRARDGVIYGYHASPSRRRHFRKALARIRDRLLEAGPSEEPHVLIVTFHDLNSFTARHMTEYLHILVEEATHVGLKPADPPFVSTPDEVARAALSRRIPPPVP
ncbi:MAG: polysaccharide deacetylase family protein [Kiritimatiellia bacterium]|nr:polysaccharide deacetylase family protein [Kiritimatiellia bacterium]